MDGNWNLTTLGTDSPGPMNKPPVSIPLSRQGSIYSWTIDQFQNSLRKDCGSMNMDEFLKNICNVEEIRGMASEDLQRQDSITMPRILSQKTVNEVWKYITKEEEHTNINNGERTSIPHTHRQQTLGEITLEELLIRNGTRGNNNNSGYTHDQSSLISSNPNTSYSDLMNNIVPRNRNQVEQLHGSNICRNVNGVMSTYQQQQQQHNQLQPKQHGYGYRTQIRFPSGQVNTHGLRGSFMGTKDQLLEEKNISFVPSLGTSSSITPLPLLDGIRKLNGDSSLHSPSPYIISDSNSVRGKRRNIGIVVENKVIEKIQRRKIKNRESAARSRARKQAQTMDLEAEFEKLKKENQELLRKEAEMSKMQTKLGMINLQEQPQRQLRRTKSDIK